MLRDASELVRRLARDARGGLPPLPLQRAAPGPLLDGGRRSQCARPVSNHGQGDARSDHDGRPSRRRW